MNSMKVVASLPLFRVVPASDTEGDVVVLGYFRRVRWCLRQLPCSMTIEHTDRLSAFFSRTNIKGCAVPDGAHN